MLVSHRKKFIYTKTRKTAGTSVESYFEKYCLPEGDWTFSHARDETVCEQGIIGFRGSQSGDKTWWNHMPAADICGLIGQEIWRNYFKFCVVRNPFDKVVSAFHFFGTQRPPEPGIEPDLLVRQFRAWLKENQKVMDRETYMINNLIAMDYFIRYEHLKEGICHVCDHLGLPFEPHDIPVLKAGVRDRCIDLRDYYDESSYAIVEANYRFELDYFGYKRPR
ncbi:MAG: sulfotransferase family 2 domain-containing protein [Proteobacteria bacterium]|nr:sulfotransferase family 2 domain-containing protein [Pseudomonadota bacterium]